MCKLLIEAGCDISHQDSSHKTAAFYAKKFGKNEVYEYLTNELQKIK
jgi:ankyrin repeat protein